jgi:hypothetical protein
MNLKKIIQEEIDDWGWAKEQIATPLTTIMAVVKNVDDIIGFKVRLSEDSEWYTDVDEDDESNPKDTVGVIVGVREWEDLLIEVEWPNFGTNTYDFEDLMVVDFNNTMNEGVESDDLDWIRDINPIIPAKYLQPNDRFMITEITGLSLEEYMLDADLEKLDPYSTIFFLTHRENFKGLPGDHTVEYIEGETIDIWLEGEDTGVTGGWVAVDEIMVTKL